MTSNHPKMSNEKLSKEQPYQRFGENIRYLTYEEWNRFLDSIDNSTHKLMMRIIYELGCRAGEFVNIQLKHLNFKDATVYIPKENVKTRKARTSALPKGLMNEIKAYLKDQGRMSKREERIRDPEEYLFPSSHGGHYTTKRIAQIFEKYLRKAGLDQEYGRDSRGKVLHRFTVHSLRHSHIMHYRHRHKLDITIVQKQVGHTTLQATQAYDRPSEEMVRREYDRARAEME